MIEITRLDPEAFKQAYWSSRHQYDRGTHTGSEYWQLAGLHAGVKLTPSQVEALLDADTDLWTQPNQPMIDWAARLQAAGTRTGILSNLGDRMTRGVLDRIPWLANFPHRIFSHQHKIAKPEPGIYQLAIDELGVPPQEILFIDDRSENCEAARVARMHVLHYLDHERFVQEMEQAGLRKLWLEGTT